MKTIWLWKNFWSQGKKARNGNFDISELAENLNEDYLLYLKARESKKDVLGWDGLSKKELEWIATDIDLLRSKIKDLVSHIHQGNDRWPQNVEMIITDFLPSLRQEINREILLLRDDLSIPDLESIINEDWNPRRKKTAKKRLKIQEGEIRPSLFSFRA